MFSTEVEEDIQSMFKKADCYYIVYMPSALVQLICSKCFFFVQSLDAKIISHNHKLFIYLMKTPLYEQ